MTARKGPNQITGDMDHDRDMPRLTIEPGASDSNLPDRPVTSESRLRSTYTGQLPADLFIKLAMFAANEQAAWYEPDGSTYGCGTVDNSDEL